MKTNFTVYSARENKWNPPQNPQKTVSTYYLHILTDDGYTCDIRTTPECHDKISAMAKETLPAPMIAEIVLLVRNNKCTPQVIRLEK